VDTRRKNWIQAGALMALLLLGALTGTAQAQTSAQMQVTAMIRRVANLQVLAQPASVRVTREDIARGYVEAPGPLQVAVRSNTVGGYLLAITTRSQFFRSAQIHGLASPLQVGPEGGAARQPAGGSGMSTATLALAVRFDLPPGAAEGEYPWPFQLSVEPL
jgi:hypothetical protein